MKRDVRSRNGMRIGSLVIAAWLAGMTGMTTGCGPTSIVSGIADLASDDNARTQIVLLLVNPTEMPIEVDLVGETANGDGEIDPEPTQVGPGEAVEVRLSRARFLRVRACEALGADGIRAPVLWDFDVTDPGIATNLTFDLESVIVGALDGSAFAGDGSGATDTLDIQRLDANFDSSAFVFTPVQASDFGFAADRVVLHPSGSYLYTLTDLGGSARIDAFRIDAETRALERIESELGSTPENPITVALANPFADLDFVIDPLGRFAYLLDRDFAGFMTTVQVFRIGADGSLEPSLGFLRDLLTTLQFRPNGEFVYVYEDDGMTSAMRSFLVDEPTGAFALQTGEAVVSCLNVQRPVVAIHPSSQFAYVTVQDGATVRVGAFFIGSGGTFTLLQTQCNSFETIFDLAFDPAGEFLYVTGTDFGGAVRVIRYPIDLGSGLLGPVDASQDLGEVSEITSGADPFVPESDAFKNIVYVAIGDGLVAHSRDATTGELTILPGSPTLPFGSPATARLVTETLSGAAVVDRIR